MPAARRRDRRGAGGRDQPTQPREGRSTVRSRSLSISLLSTSLLLLLLAVVAIAALFIVYRGDESGIEGTEPSSLSVYERGLVNPNLDYREILAENSRFSENTSRRHFTNPVLAYVTPWNSRGYEMAKLFGSKLTHVSPIWYELKSEGKKLVLEGRHNVDKEWISELWNNGHPLVIGQSESLVGPKPKLLLGSP